MTKVDLLCSNPAKEGIAMSRGIEGNTGYSIESATKVALSDEGEGN